MQYLKILKKLATSFWYIDVLYVFFIVHLHVNLDHDIVYYCFLLLFLCKHCFLTLWVILCVCMCVLPAGLYAYHKRVCVCVCVCWLNLAQADQMAYALPSSSSHIMWLWLQVICVIIINTELCGVN